MPTRRAATRDTGRKRPTGRERRPAAPGLEFNHAMIYTADYLCDPDGHELSLYTAGAARFKKTRA